MTEAEWLAATDPKPMLEFLKGKACDRKLRLFACQACYRLGSQIKEQGLEALAVAERFADGLADERDLGFAHGRLGRVAMRFKQGSEEPGFQLLPFVAIQFSLADTDYERLSLLPVMSSTDGSVLLREMFGNPFRPLTLNPSWLTSTVLALAQQIYDSRDFSPMPILADALQDAGCDNEDILNHCRHPGEHVRGCFVVDLLLGKT
jgi:hypothetical protein